MRKLQQKKTGNLHRGKKYYKLTDIVLRREKVSKSTVEPEYCAMDEKVYVPVNEEKK